MTSVNGIEVRLRHAVNDTSGVNRMCVRLSWHGGTSWTAAQQVNVRSTTIVEAMCARLSDEDDPVPAAESLPGVRAVLTAADFPQQGDRVVELGEGSVNMRHLSANILARDKVLYRGHAIAAALAQRARDIQRRFAAHA